MAERYKLLPPALKHGAFAGMGLLPGEDPDAFARLRSELNAEHIPAGRHEESIVETIACLIWRKQNLKIYRVAEEARSRYSQIWAELAPKSDFPTLGELRDPEDIRKAEKIADRKARKELGAAWELVASGDLLTMEHLMDELAVVERLNAMISRCLKQLLFVRGLKSLPSPASAPRQITQAA